MTQWEAIIGKLEDREPLNETEIDYLKRVFAAAKTFLPLILQQAVGEDV